MTVLAPPRHHLIEAALADARRWCAGRIIDDRPALTHAARVAVTLGQHLPEADPTLIAAALLHDSPEFAPPDMNLDAALTAAYGSEVTRIVRALEAEHAALDCGHPTTAVDDLPVLTISTADQIVALSSLFRRARLSGDVHQFFAGRTMLLTLLPHFARAHRLGTGLVPPSMSNHLQRAIEDMDVATSALRAGL